jgi:hypothetical protein
MDPLQNVLSLVSDFGQRLSQAGQYATDACQEHPLAVAIIVLAVVGVLFFRTALRWIDDGSLPDRGRGLRRMRH